MIKNNKKRKILTNNNNNNNLLLVNSPGLSKKLNVASVSFLGVFFDIL